MNDVTNTNLRTKLEVLTSEEFQEIQADNLEKELNQDGNAEKTGSTISDFVLSYEKHKTEMPLNEWLVFKFKQHPEAWQNEEDLTNSATQVISAVTQANADKASLYAHLDAGKSQESWLAKQIEQGAKSAGVVNVGEYAGQIDAAITQANADMVRTVTRLDGGISEALNLDGFIAEQHHVDTFNLEAAAKGSGYRAKALVPDGTTYGKNSMDIGIYDSNGKLVKRYQAKYGQDAKATQDLFGNKYPGQQKLVPADQVNDIEGATDCIEVDGIKSKPATKAEMKAMQEKAQLHSEIKKYEWNEVSRGEIAKTIGKQALISAGLTAGFQGVRVFGRRIWNNLLGKENPPLSKDMQDFFESSIKSATHVGVQVAVSGAVLVSARNGWLGAVLKGTPAGRIANMVYLAMENAKVLAKLAKGELTGVEAMDAIGKTTTSLAVSLAAAVEGGMLGAAYGSVFGPVGTFAGGLIGGIVGGIAGGKVGEYIYEGGKSIVKSAVSMVSSVASTVYDGVKSVANALNPLNWF
ncbi:MAG: hypothetical protein HOP24_02815 [Sideroxydans sp.]|nr:hypothetical protein [Sideroxydans sp.]